MEKKLKVQLRNGFSDRMNIKPINKQIQLTSFDERTRAAIINTCLKAFEWYATVTYEAYKQLRLDILTELYAQDLSDLSMCNHRDIRDLIVTTIREDDYDDILTVVEYLTKKMDGNIRPTVVAKAFNEVFEREYVGYRFIDTDITPITDKVEIEAIEAAMTTSRDEVQEHIEKAVGFLSDRQTPDYENSVKESITAVERMCSIILGKQAVLSDALKKLEKGGVVIHPVLKMAFERLYNYTSDASGIRHAGQLGGKDTTFEEAKFMLVSCSAFVNYLKGVQAKTP